MIEKIVSAILVSMFFVGILSSTGCSSTWEGIGKDIEKIGKDIQD